MTLYLEVDEYIENYSSGYGVRIVFHEPGTFPMPAEEGLTLSPGYETSIGLRAVRIIFKYSIHFTSVFSHNEVYLSVNGVYCLKCDSG